MAHSRKHQLCQNGGGAHKDSKVAVGERRENPPVRRIIGVVFVSVVDGRWDLYHTCSTLLIQL
jgi:hypothetical protein